MNEQAQKHLTNENEIELIYDDQGFEVADSTIKQAKQEFLDGYFVTKVKRFNTSDSRDGKLVDHVMVAANHKSQSHISRLFKKYGYQFDGYDGFMDEVVSIIGHLVMTFNPVNFDWDKLNQEGTAENNRIHAYISKVNKNNVTMLESLLLDAIRFGTYQIRVGGQVKDTQMAYLDAEYTNDEGETTSLLDGLTDENRLFARGNYDEDGNYTGNGFYRPHFSAYFLDEWLPVQKQLRGSKSREDQSQSRLTKQQIKYIDDCFKGHEGSYSPNQRYQFNLKIKEAYETDYYAIWPEGVSFFGMKVLAQREMLQKMLDAINDDRFTPEQQLSKVIEINQTNQIVVDLLNKINPANAKLIAESVDKSKRKRDRKVIGREPLYDFLNAIDARLEELNGAEIGKPEKFKKLAHEYPNGDKAAYLKKREDVKQAYREMKNAPVTVYDASGNVLRVEEYKAPKEKKKSILTAFGEVESEDIF